MTTEMMMGASLEDLCKEFEVEMEELFEEEDK
jgi:hypothetical protein